MTSSISWANMCCATRGEIAQCVLRTHCSTAKSKSGIELIAYVVMPNHVHVVLTPWSARCHKNHFSH